MTREAHLIRPEGPVPYGPANEAMHLLAEQRLAGEVPDTVILVEHPPVFTAGRRARPDELLWSPDEVAARGAEVHRIDRGGAFTFHGPGQIVGYPIIDLGPKPDAAAHLRRMEEAVIRTAEEFGVALHRREDVQTGVWHGDDKVCAIGVRLMRARVTLAWLRAQLRPRPVVVGRHRRLRAPEPRGHVAQPARRPTDHRRGGPSRPGAPPGRGLRAHVP